MSKTPGFIFIVALIAFIFACLTVADMSRVDIAQPETASPGTRIADGTIYVGISPSDERPLFVMPHDIEGTHPFVSAHTSTCAQTFGGHTDWRVPTIDELNQLYTLKELIGGFHTSPYWSSTEYTNNDAWSRNFGSGFRFPSNKGNDNRVRCVRSG